MASNSHAFFVAAKRVDAVDRAQVPRLRSCQLGKAYTALLQKVLSSLPKLATRPSYPPQIRRPRMLAPPSCSTAFLRPWRSSISHAVGSRSSFPSPARKTTGPDIASSFYFRHCYSENETRAQADDAGNSSANQRGPRSILTGRQHTNSRHAAHGGAVHKPRCRFMTLVCCPGLLRGPLAVPQLEVGDDVNVDGPQRVDAVFVEGRMHHACQLNLFWPEPEEPAPEAHGGGPDPSPLSVPPHALPYCCIARDADPLQQAGHLWRCAVREPQSTSSRRGRHHSCSIVSSMSLKINTRRSHSRSAAIRWVPHPFLDYHRHWAARTFHHRAHPDPRGHRGTRQSHADGGDGKLMQMGDSASMAYFLGQRSRLYMSCWTTAPRRRDIPANHAAENSRDESALRIGHRCGGSQSCGFLARLVDPWDIDRK